MLAKLSQRTSWPASGHRWRSHLTTGALEIARLFVYVGVSWAALSQGQQIPSMPASGGATTYPTTSTFPVEQVGQPYPTGEQYP